MKYQFRRHSKRVLVALAGGLVVLIGLALVPYPGPGWLIIFAGLAILATEFEFAKRWRDALRKIYTTWQQWLKRQPMLLRIAILLLTGIVVVLTIWLINGFGATNRFLHLGLDWLNSPLLH